MEVRFNTQFINGQFQTGASAEVMEVIEKYSGRLLARVNHASDADVEHAVESAVKGFSHWSQTSAEHRAELLRNVADALEQEADLFTQLICAEAGKPIALARVEVMRAVGVLRLSAEEALRISGQVFSVDWGVGTGKQAMSKRFPIGPVLGFSPFNFPLNLAMHKLGPALACGCSIVLKLPPQAPLSMLYLCSLFQRCGLPAGVLNAVVCSNTAAQKLVIDERFALFSFTGSDSVGWQLKNLAGKKKVVLELGGNAAVIVDKSAGLMKAAREIARSAFMYGGQVCISVQRIVVHETVYEEFKALLLQETSCMVSGNPADENVLIGPLISKAAANATLHRIAEAVEAGAVCVSGGTYLDEEHNLIAPTLLEKVSFKSSVWCDEAFAPLACLTPFDEFDVAIDIANNSRFGLQAGVFSNDFSNINAAMHRLRAGTVLINAAPGLRMDHLPYGGLKDSGMGKEGVRSAIEEMTEERVLIW